jgi:hypothetical protein
LAPSALSLNDASAGTAKRVAIRLHKPTRGGLPTAFDVAGLNEAVLRRWAKANYKPDQWTAIFAIYVVRAKESDVTKQPAVLGTYQVRDDVLRFTPRFSLVRGVRYRAFFNPSAAQFPGKRVMAEFVLPRKKTDATTVVENVYPTSNKLPENLLKFYIHFSAPMSQGNVYRNLKLLGPSGKAIELPFLELQDELWDAEGKRLTLLFDPGRIKRGLKPREELGPVLEEGKTYTFVIDPKWRDARANPLRKAFRKTFKVLAPLHKGPDPGQWKVVAPPAGTRTPLVIRFPRPLDHALLSRVLWVADAKGKVLEGKVSLSQEETRWHFTPQHVWPEGTYSLRVQTTLEDLAGNNIVRPFEVDVFRPMQRKVKTKTLKIPFAVGQVKNVRD